MSSTTHASTDQSDSVYRTLVFRNPDICSGCFSRLKDTRVGTYTSANGEHNVTASTRVRAGEPGHDIVPIEDPDAREHTPRGVVRPRTVCGTCGRFAGRAPDDSRSHQRLGRLAGRLAERLDELGVHIDRTALHEALSAHKSDPDLQGNETEIWTAAVAAATRN